MKFLLLILKNLRREKLRTILTGLAVMVLTAIFCFIATILRFLDATVYEKSSNIPLLITDRYRNPSRVERGHMDRIIKPGYDLNTKLSQVPGFHAEKVTYWHMAAFTLDPELKDQRLMFFCIATPPDTISLNDGLEEIDPQLIQLMKDPPRSGLANAGILMGRDILKQLGKQVGDVFNARSITHRDLEGKPIEMDFEIVGRLPDDWRYIMIAFMDYERLDGELKLKRSDRHGIVDIGWLYVDDPDSAQEVAAIIEREIPELRCETLSAAISRFVEMFGDILWGIKYILVPSIWGVMTLVLANSISITVRERRMEMALLKVLGFRPYQILLLVLGEIVLLGSLAGLAAGGLLYGIIEVMMGGLRLPGEMYLTVSAHALWWGPVLGAVTATLGGILPAWSACSIRVSEVFARVA